MDSGCKQCKKIDGLCIDCAIEQADWEVDRAMSQLEELKKKKELQEKDHVVNSNKPGN